MVSRPFSKKLSLDDRELCHLLEYLQLEVHLRHTRIIILLRFFYAKIKVSPHDDSSQPRHGVIEPSDVFQSARTTVHMHRRRILRHIEKCIPEILFDRIKQDMQRAVTEIIVIARDENIFAAARLHGSMDVPFRTDILLVAVIAKLLVHLLHLLNECSCVIGRSVVRDENFDLRKIPDLSQYTRQ